MAPRTKQDYPALIEEYERRVQDETIQTIKSDFQSRGVHWGTFQNHRTQAKKKAPRETPMSVDETPVEVLPGQMSIKDTDTPVGVSYDAVNEVDELPDGYAKTIQPMQPYSDAEEWALGKSMELYGFLGAIVLDQYGRVLDGNQRQRIARLRGLAVPHTVTLVRDDAHAIEIARTLNTIRRHYTKEQREDLAPIMRDQGFSYRAIAEALGVGVATVYRDVFGVLRERPETADGEPVPNGTPEPVTHPNETIMHTSDVPNGTPEPVMAASTPEQAPEPPKLEKRVKGRDDKSYPAQRPKALQTAHTPVVDIEDRLPKIRDMVRESLSICRTGGQIRALSSVLVRCARMLEDRAKQLQVQPYNSITILPTLITDKSLSDQEPEEPPAQTIDNQTMDLIAEPKAADEVQGTDELGTCYECGVGLTVEDAVICRHCGEMFHGPCQQSHMDQEDDASADADE